MDRIMETLSPHFSTCGTLQSRGYHMTEENVQELQDNARGKYYRLREILALAKTRMENTGKEMSKVGSELQSKNPRDWSAFSFSSYPWLNQEYVQRLGQDIAIVEREVSEARVKAIQLGVALSE